MLWGQKKKTKPMSNPPTPKVYFDALAPAIISGRLKVVKELNPNPDLKLYHVLDQKYGTIYLVYRSWDRYHPAGMEYYMPGTLTIPRAELKALAKLYQDKHTARLEKIRKWRTAKFLGRFK